MKYIDAEKLKRFVDELKQFIYDLIKKDKAVGKEPDDDLFTILGHLEIKAHPRWPILDACWNEIHDAEIVEHQKWIENLRGRLK